MAGFNQVTLVGRLTDLPDVRATTTGKKVAKFTLAVDKFKEGANFFECEYWNNSADFIEKYLNKGDQVLVSGSIDQQVWQDKETGKNRSKIIVLGNQITALQTKKRESVANDAGEPIDLSDIPF